MARKKVIKNLRWSELADTINLEWGRDFRDKYFVVGEFYDFVEPYQNKIYNLEVYGDIDKFRIKVVKKLEDGDYLVDVTNYSNLSAEEGVLSYYI